MNLTVIVPVHNNSGSIERVVAAIRSGLRDGDRLLAVNDRSSDTSVELLRNLRVEVVESAGRPGAAATRNTGAFLAETQWILFVDADVVVPRGWREMLAGRLGGVQAVQAVYSKVAVGRNAATFYKNYYYYYTFTKRIRGPFIKGCGTFFFAVETEVFRELGGFDENIHGASIEDADFSERLWARGGKILIAKEIEVLHLREYTTPELIGYEWNMMVAKARYLLRRGASRGMPSISVAGFTEMLSVITGAVFSWLFIAAALLCFFGNWQLCLVALAAFFVVFAGNISFAVHSVIDGGVRGLKACGFILPDLLLVVPAVATAVATRFMGRKY